jgi:8-oxo-dGTP diphosphatase
MEIVRTRVSAVIIREKKILLVRGNSGFYKDFYFTPGGKIEEGEDDIEALNRELKEELSIESVKATYFFEYVANGWAGGMQKVKCYFVNLKIEDIILASEIGKMIWYGREDFEEKKIAFSPSMAEFLIPRLIEEGYL